MLGVDLMIAAIGVVPNSLFCDVVDTSNNIDTCVDAGIGVGKGTTITTSISIRIPIPIPIPVRIIISSLK